MASEESCKINPPVSANGRGFFGSSASTINLCSKCFQVFCLDQQQPVASIATMNAMVDGTTTRSATAGAVLPSSSIGESAEKRLAGGFKCRCGETYCAVHRYLRSCCEG